MRLILLLVYFAAVVVPGSFSFGAADACCETECCCSSSAMACCSSEAPTLVINSACTCGESHEPSTVCFPELVRDLPVRPPVLPGKCVFWPAVQLVEPCRSSEPSPEPPPPRRWARA